MVAPFLNGLFLGLSLIMAIGAQNAMVIKMGIMGRHCFFIALFCALSDAILIAVGVAGGGYIFAKFPLFIDIMRWGGAIYIAWFIKNLILELRTDHALQLQKNIGATLWGNIKLIAGVTWLNPHVYLDTIGLISAVSAPFAGFDRITFAIGAMTASFFWFFSIMYGAKLFAPILQKPKIWRGINIAIIVIMTGILVNLVFIGYV